MRAVASGIASVAAMALSARPTSTRASARSPSPAGPVVLGREALEGGKAPPPPDHLSASFRMI